LLTLKEPIQLKNRAVTSLGTSFGEHIRENYEQINQTVSSEDLLHIVTQPAEVFYAEGNQTSIFNRNVKIENVNEQKIDIVNRLINRILIANQGNFTYQDRTYISNYLNKLGIKDEQRFMSRITEMMSERETQTKVLRELNTRVDNLRERIPEVLESIKARAEEAQGENQPGDITLKLAENIYNRLQTDRVYDTVWNFNHQSHLENNITNKELNLSEQKRSSTFIKLNNLAQNIVGAPVNMIHYKGNIFEDTDVYEEIINNPNEEIIRDQLAQSSLYNLIEQVYESRNTNIDKGISESFNINNAMFETAGNTFSRYVENIVTPVVNRTVEEIPAEPVVRQVLNYLENQTTEQVTEQQIINDIKKIDEQNIDNENRYIRVMQQLQQRIDQGKPQIVHTQDRTIRESLSALDDPTELLIRYREEQVQNAEAKEKEQDLYLEAYPEKVRPFLKFIDGVMKSKQSAGMGPTDPTDALSLLNEDIAAIELQHREEAAPVIPETDLVRNTYVENIVEQIMTSPKGTVLQETVNRATEINRNINLVHKLTDTINETEILERIDELRNETRENRTQTVTETEDVVTTVNRYNNEEHVVNETINTEEITNLIRQNVISQMGELSDQVYSRIEKKLQNEKIRRGF